MTFEDRINFSLQHFLIFTFFTSMSHLMNFIRLTFPRIAFAIAFEMNEYTKILYILAIDIINKQLERTFFFVTFPMQIIFHSRVSKIKIKIFFECFFKGSSLGSQLMTQNAKQWGNYQYSWKNNFQIKQQWYESIWQRHFNDTKDTFFVFFLFLFFPNVIWIVIIWPFRSIRPALLHFFYL